MHGLNGLERYRVFKSGKTRSFNPRRTLLKLVAVSAPAALSLSETIKRMDWIGDLSNRERGGLNRLPRAFFQQFLNCFFGYR